MVKFIQNIKPIFALYALLVMSVILTLASFYLEYGHGAVPCRMCWWQRYTHWLLWAVSLSGIFLVRYFNPVYFLRIALFLVILSGAIGFYQGLGQVGIIVLPEFCGNTSSTLAEADKLLELLTKGADKVPNCADKGFTIFNISLAWWNLMLMSATALVMVVWMAGKYNRTK